MSDYFCIELLKGALNATGNGSCEGGDFGILLDYNHIIELIDNNSPIIQKDIYPEDIYPVDKDVTPSYFLFDYKIKWNDIIFHISSVCCNDETVVISPKFNIIDFELVKTLFDLKSHLDKKFATATELGILLKGCRCT